MELTCIKSRFLFRHYRGCWCNRRTFESPGRICFLSSLAFRILLTLRRIIPLFFRSGSCPICTLSPPAQSRQFFGHTQTDFGTSLTFRLRRLQPISFHEISWNYWIHINSTPLAIFCFLWRYCIHGVDLVQTHLLHVLRTWFGQFHSLLTERVALLWPHILFDDIILLPMLAIKSSFCSLLFWFWPQK